MTTLRISGGTLRGRNVPVPPGDLRPTSNKARQAFFNMIGPSIAGARFLDLFAGSGIFSFEAISRGASRAVAVEISSKSCASIRELSGKLGVKIDVIQRDALQALPHLAGPFDLVYADPPYDWSAYEELFEALDAADAKTLAVDATLAIEHRSDDPRFDGTTLRNLTHRKTASYGTVAISLFDRRAGNDEVKKTSEADVSKSSE